MTQLGSPWFRVAAAAALTLLFGLSNCSPVQRTPTIYGPLRILRTLPAEPAATFFPSSNCQALNPEFKLTVDGADPSDELNSLWFVDQTSGSQPFRPAPVPGGPSQKLVTAPASLDFKGALRDPGSATHVLTVFVSDGVFDEVVDDQITASRESLDGGTERLLASVVSFSWTLELKPSCP